MTRFEQPKMQFPMPRQKLSHDEYMKAKKLSCDHLGTKKVYVHGVWECERCGKPDTK